MVREATDRTFINTFVSTLEANDCKAFMNNIHEHEARQSKHQESFFEIFLKLEHFAIHHFVTSAESGEVFRAFHQYLTDNKIFEFADLIAQARATDISLLSNDELDWICQNSEMHKWLDLYKIAPTDHKRLSMVIRHAKNCDSISAVDLANRFTNFRGSPLFFETQGVNWLNILKDLHVEAYNLIDAKKFGSQALYHLDFDSFEEVFNHENYDKIIFPRRFAIESSALFENFWNKFESLISQSLDYDCEQQKYIFSRVALKTFLEEQDSKNYKFITSRGYSLTENEISWMNEPSRTFIQSFDISNILDECIDTLKYSKTEDSDFQANCTLSL
jgi:hypothetical protein